VAVYFICITLAFGTNVATVKASIVIKAGSLSIGSKGFISIPINNIQLNEEDQKVVAKTAPVFFLEDSTGTEGSWALTFQASDLVDVYTGRTIAASNFLFKPAISGTIIRLTGQPIDPVNGPREVIKGEEIPLDIPRAIVCTSDGHGKGRYLFITHPASFVQKYSSNISAGNYSSTLTVTLSMGP